MVPLSGTARGRECLEHLFGLRVRLCQEIGGGKGRAACLLARFFDHLPVPWRLGSAKLNQPHPGPSPGAASESPAKIAQKTIFMIKL